MPPLDLSRLSDEELRQLLERVAGLIDDTAEGGDEPEDQRLWLQVCT